MAAATRSDSKRKYSWWWDSHISPKNSKWLQENLTDMDAKVKQMIKLLEEDADSFARRADMYYRQRPELMKLVEEFYRAYRALAERYDHATIVIRQAHKTMAEAFPNQVPFMLGDDSPAGFADVEPRTPDMLPIRAPFDPEELQKDALGISQSPHAFKRNGAFTDESDSVTGRKGLKQLNDFFGSAEGRARKGLNFHDAEEEEQNRARNEIKARVPSDSERMSKAEMEILSLKNALSKLEAEKEAGLLQYQQSLERLSNLESEVSRAKEDSEGLNERASKAEAEVQTLKEMLTKLEAEKESSFLQYQQCLEKIAKLEYSISHAQENAGELNERASKAECEAQSLKQEVAKLEAENEDALLHFKQCLEKISDLENNLLHAEDNSMRFNERADKAEKEVETLKQAIARLTEEKEAAAVQYQQCLDTISVLEHKLATAQEEAQRLKSEIDDGVVKLKGAEERCLLLEKSNQTMHSELESVAQKMATQSEELTEKQKELGRLWTCIQEERLRFVEAETAFQTLQHLHSQSQEELRSMAAELKNRTQMLQDLEARNRNLQNEIEEVKVDYKSLTEINVSSTLTIEGLQDETASLRETIGKLEAEVELRLDERNALQQEIYCLKEELNDLNKKHQAIMEQVELVGFSSESLGSSVKDLQDENMKLQEFCERERNEKMALLEKLEIMEKLMEKNAVLENSLSDLNVELQGVREKVRALEESCQSLLKEKSSLVSEKATLVTQLRIATGDLLKLMDKNNFLENSLFDANAEIEMLKMRSNSLQDSYTLLKNEKSDLASENGSLVCQLGTTQKRLEQVEKNYVELEERYSSLEKGRQSALNEVGELRTHLDAQKQEHASLVQLNESQLANMATQIHLLQEEGQCMKKEHKDELDKAFSAQKRLEQVEKNYVELEKRYSSLEKGRQSALNEVGELRTHLDAQKQEHASLVQLNESQLASMATQIHLLQEEGQCMKKEHEDELDKAFSAQTEIFILHKCVQDLEENNFSLLLELQKLLEASKLSKKLISELEHENLEQQVEVKSLYDQIKVLRVGLYGVLKTLGLDSNQWCEGKAEQDQFLLNHALAKLQQTQKYLYEMQDENQQMFIENSVIVTLLAQLQQEVENLVKAKNTLDQELACRSEQFSVLQSENQEILEMNELLSSKILEGELKEEELKVELKNLQVQFIAMQGACEMLQEENCKVLDEKRSLMNSISELGEERSNLEDENCAFFAETASLGIRSLIFKDIISEKFLEIEELSKEVECVHKANLKLESEQQILNEELVEAKSQEENLNYELHKGRNEVERWEAQVAALVGELQISAVQQALVEGKARELTGACKSLEGRICSKDVDIDQLKKRVRTLGTELQISNEQLLEAKSREEILNYELQKGRNEVEQWETQVAALVGELQISAVQQALFEGKAHELIEACGILEGRICSKDVDIDQLKERVCTLGSELQILNEALVEAKSREENLNYELQKGRNEVEQWEAQVAALVGELQISAVQQALFEGKAHELIEACESLEGRICSNDVDIDQLKERASTLGSENEELRTQVISCIPAFISLRDSITSLENHTLSHGAVHEVENKEAKEAAHAESFEKISEEQDVMGPGKILNLQRRLRAIEEAVMERERLFILEMSSANSKLEAGNGQIEELKSRKSFRRDRKHGSRNPEDKELGHERSCSGNEVTKDIMLDQMSECSSYGISRRETVEPDNQMLEIWETAEQNASIDLTVGKSQKKRSKEHPSRESMIEKDVNVDKLEISRRLSGSRQEMSERKILERLDSDAQKLTNLQITVQDLKRKVDITEKNKKGKGIEYNSVKEQLEESEEAIMKLFDVNRKLMKSIEDEPLSSDEKSALASDDNGSNRRKRISEQARRGSEKIGRLQLEVQKLQFLLLKLDDENKSRGKTKIIERKTRVLLRDYLYGGTRTGQKKKKRHFCACVQPPTKGD